MKKKFLRYFLLVFIFSMACMQALPAAERGSKEEFEQAAEAYFKRDFTKAIQLYTDLEKKGLISSDLFYNLANTYYRQGHIGWAIYYYTKALRYAPRDRDLVANARYVLGKRADQIEKPFVSKVYHSLFFWYDILTLKELLILTAIFYWIFFAFLALRVMKNKKGISIALWVNLSINLILLPTAAAKFYTERLQKIGVMVAATVAVYSEPNADSIKLYELHEGALVEVEDQSEKFVKIRLPDGRVGWVDMTQLKTIP